MKTPIEPVEELKNWKSDHLHTSGSYSIESLRNKPKSTLMFARASNKSSSKRSKLSRFGNNVATMDATGGLKSSKEHLDSLSQTKTINSK